MGYRYIGSKTRIVEEILSKVKKIVSTGGTIIDLMSGTGAVSIELRKRGYKVIANDVMAQAYHITKVKVLLQNEPTFLRLNEDMFDGGVTTLVSPSRYNQLLNVLNNIEPVAGYFHREFSPDGTPDNGCSPRKYFTSTNAKKIDAVRNFVSLLRGAGQLADVEYSLLIHDLIMAANDVANIAGTYGHYLSTFNERSLLPFSLKPMRFLKGGRSDGHNFHNSYAESIASSLQGDLCYIDPPYRKRQYAANYHILETIAKGDEPEAVGQSGLRPWRDEYSNFCSKLKIRPSFRKVLEDMQCENFLVSYNSEGLLTLDELVKLLREFGPVEQYEFQNKRFKSRNETADEDVTEYLLWLRRGT